MTTQNSALPGPQLSAIAGALAGCMVWLAGTLAIFAIQGGGVA